MYTKFRISGFTWCTSLSVRINPIFSSAQIAVQSIFFQVCIVLGMYIFASSLKDGWRCDDKLCAQAIALKLFYEDIIFHCCCYDWWLYLGAKSAPLTLFSSVQLSSLKLFKLVWIGRKMSKLHSLHPSFLEWVPCTINNKVKNQLLLS